MKKIYNIMFINNEKLFLTEEEFKSMVPSSRNVTDTQSIYYSIALSQRQTIKGMLGDDLYEDINSKYTLYIDSGTSMSDCYTYLVENFIKPILSFSTYKRLITTLSFKLKEGGLRYNVDQTSELAMSEDRNIIIRDINNDIDLFIIDMKKYIYDNRSCFPLYNKGFDGVVDNQVSFGIGKITNPTKNIYSDGASIYPMDVYYKRK
jgi:hypothetical protein